jgi:hypothetical protein
MEKAPTLRTCDWLVLGLVLLATASVCIPGIESRDLTGDELGALGRDVGQMLDRSIEVHRPEHFSAHLPLAWLARAGFHKLLGADNAWVWRLHGLLGALLAAALTWFFVRPYSGRAMAAYCGLFVGLCPILTFHSRDSTNYALDPMTGILLLGALAAVATAKRGAGFLLAFALMLGSINDYYFFVSVAVVAALSPFLVLSAADRRGTARALLLGWGLYLAGVALPAWEFLKRLKGVDFASLFSRHADPAEGPAGAIVEHLEPQLRAFGLAYLEGYEAVPYAAELGSEVGFWLLLITSTLGLLSRCPLRRSAALLVAGSALLLISFAVVFQNHTGRSFPVFPRNYLTLLPGLAVLWIGCFHEFMGKRWGRPAIFALLLLVGLVSTRQALNVSDSRLRLMKHMNDFAEPSDTLISEVNLKLRVDHLNFAEVGGDYCLSNDAPLPERFWLWTLKGSRDAPTPTPTYCPDTPIDGYQVRLSAEADIPPHDRDTNSHLGPIRVYLFERSSSSEAVAAPPWTLLLDDRPLSGAKNAHVSAFWADASGGLVASYDGPFAPSIHLGPAPPSATHFTLRVRADGLPEWIRKTRLSPDDESIMHFDDYLLATNPIRPEIRFPLWALGSPWLHVLRQSLLWVIALSLQAVVLAALWRAGGPWCRRTWARIRPR